MATKERERDRARAIADARAMRQTHVDWLEHLKPGIIKGQVYCQSCAESGVEQIVGDAEHQEECIARYANILAVLDA